MHEFCAQATSKVNVEEEEKTNLRWHIPTPHTFQCDCPAVESFSYAGDHAANGLQA
jgi:hypothetical protein